MTAARMLAREAAAARLAQGKRPQVTVEVKCGDQLGKVSTMCMCCPCCSTELLTGPQRVSSAVSRCVWRRVCGHLFVRSTCL